MAALARDRASFQAFLAPELEAILQPSNPYPAFDICSLRAHISYQQILFIPFYLSYRLAEGISDIDKVCRVVIEWRLEKILVWSI